MGRVLVRAGAALCLAAPVGVSQNELHHYDGTTNFTSRGSFPGDPKTLLQRIPGDQACGAAQIAQAFLNIQDQDALTPESYQFQVRADDPAMPGKPDMSITGLLGSSAVIPVQFPGSGIVAMSATLTFSPPIPVPAGAPGVPGGDVYVGLELPAAPLWTSDGISLHMSGGSGGPTAPGEQQNPLAPGYTGLPGIAGLAWEYNLNPFSGPQGPNATPTIPNRAWDLRTRFVEGVTQGFAWNPMVFNGIPTNQPTDPGLNPNFGYAGIWPDMLRVPGPDGFGFRVRAAQPVGSSAFLDVILGLVPTVLGAGQPVSSSQAQFGPFAGNAAFVGAILHAQGVTIGTNGIALSSLCTMFL